MSDPLGLTDEEFTNYQKARAVAGSPVSKGDTIVIHSSRINGTFLVGSVEGAEDGFGVSMECRRVDGPTYGAPRDDLLFSEPPGAGDG